MEQQRFTWGGRRKNAGRKASTEEGTITISLRITPSVKAELKKQAASEGKTIRQLIEEMLEDRRRAEV